MKRTYKRLKFFIIGALAAATMTSCMKDLDTFPIDQDDITAEKVYADPANYIKVLAKCYAGLAVSGQQGPAGSADISGYDEGAAQYLRAYWNLQELPTDEAVVGWNDPGLPELNYSTWSSNNGFIYVMYSRIYLQVGYVNEYLRQTTEDKLNSRGITGEVRNQIPQFRDEARFLRALSYWHAIDLFGNVPFVTEEDPVGAFMPKQISRADLFNYVESELKSIEANNLIPVAPEYPRIGMSAVQFLLAKLYLNAEVYTGTARWNDAKIYVDKVIAAKGTNTLASQYKYLFGGDNDQFVNNGANGEIIFAIAYSENETRTYGGTTYLTFGAYGGDLDPVKLGLNGGWGGIRTTPNLVDKFDAADTRSLFFKTDNKENTNIALFTDGYTCIKYTNLLSSDWENTAGRKQPWPDTDYPMFRMADAYLMAAEIAVRTGADRATALGYVNELRKRAGLGAISDTQMTLDYILNERCRELYWEAQRRQDLIRFGKFTGGSYVWSWKGGVLTGKSTDSKYRLYPIPAQDIAANPNIIQNDGY